jgi:hypothetical protein
VPICEEREEFAEIAGICPDGRGDSGRLEGHSRSVCADALSRAASSAAV